MSKISILNIEDQWQLARNANTLRLPRVAVSEISILCVEDQWQPARNTNSTDYTLSAGLPVFTGPLYGWSGSENGLLLAVLGFASLPLSFLVGALSPRVSDRVLTAGALSVTAVGAALCTKAGDPLAPATYFGGGGMLYMVRRRPQGPIVLVTIVS